MSRVDGDKYPEHSWIIWNIIGELDLPLRAGFGAAFPCFIPMHIGAQCGYKYADTVWLFWNTIDVTDSFFPHCPLHTSLSHWRRRGFESRQVHLIIPMDRGFCLITSSTVAFSTLPLVRRRLPIGSSIQGEDLELLLSPPRFTFNIPTTLYIPYWHIVGLWDKSSLLVTQVITGRYKNTWI
jgi:hypothetical protein